MIDRTPPGNLPFIAQQMRLRPGDAVAGMAPPALNAQANPPVAEPEAKPKQFSFMSALKNFGKGLISPITSLFESRTNFLMGVGMIVGGGLLLLATGGLAAPALLTLGVGMGVFQGATAAYKIATAKDNEEIEKAFFDIGSAVSVTGMSLLGAKASLRGASNVTGLTSAQVDKMSMFSALVQNIKSTPKSISTSFNAFRSGEYLTNLSGLLLSVKKPTVSPNSNTSPSVLPPEPPVVTTSVSTSSPAVSVPTVKGPAVVNPTTQGSGPASVAAPVTSTPVGTVSPTVSVAPVKAPVLPANIRGPQQLNATEVTALLNKQLNLYTEADIMALVSGLSPADQVAALHTLKQMAQFGTMESLNALIQEVSLLQRSGNHVLMEDGVLGSLSSIVKYLKSKGNFSGLKMKELPAILSSGKKAALLLDNAVLHRMKTDPAFLKLIQDNKIRLIVPEGWNTGVNPFNQAGLSSIEGNLTPALSRVRANLQKAPGQVHQAVSEALLEPTLAELRTISPHLEAQVKVIRNKNVSLTQKAPAAAEIAEQLRAPGFSEAEVQAVLSKVSSEPVVQQATLELLMRGAEVYSPRRVGLEMQSLHQSILQKAQQLGHSAQDIYYVVANPEKSYTIVNAMYRNVNGIPPNRFISMSDVSALGSKPKMVVILDDLAGSGDSLKSMYSSMKTHLGAGDHVVISPVISTRMAQQNVFAPAMAADSRLTYLPGRVVTAFHETSYFQNLSAPEKALFTAIFQDKGYGSANTMSVFPWMGTDTNNLFFGRFFVPKYLFNGNGNKVTGSHWTAPQLSLLPPEWLTPVHPGISGTASGLAPP